MKKLTKLTSLLLSGLLVLSSAFPVQAEGLFDPETLDEPLMELTSPDEPAVSGDEPLFCFTMEEDLDLLYDDRYDLHNEYEDFEVKKIETLSVSSSTVKNGTDTGVFDTKVVQEKDHTLIACGVGEALVTLEKKR